MTIPTSTGPMDDGLDKEALRRAVRDAAEASVDAVFRRQFEVLKSGEDFAEDGYLSYGSEHTGDAPIPLDAAAREAVSDVLDARLPVIAPGRRRHPAGEEAGGGTAVLRTGDLISRSDDLDGSTNADCLLNNFSAVVGIDLVREPSGPRRRSRHLAGAIASSTGVTVSWTNESKWVPQLGRHSSYRGSVYFSSAVRGIDEFRVSDPRWDRRDRTYAGVASKRRRLDALLSSIDDPSGDAVIYNVAGTPVVAALLAGALAFNLEVESVTLHDSMHLIPHQLLGGRILNLASSRPLDYLAMYEREAGNLDPTAKPIPPYIALGGLAREVSTTEAIAQ